MYYPQQSPGIQKLTHDQNPWTRAAPGYAMYNGAMHPQPYAHAPMHHHQNSINHYTSPPVHPPQDSPVPMPGQVMSQHWQQQLLKYELVRSSRSPHHRARANAMAARSHQKSAIPITNPNTIKSPATSHDSPDSSPANHPSATVAPIAPLNRPTNGPRAENNWTSLDMGGVSIKTLPPMSKLFSWRFLINLYLNHNQLTSLPPGIRFLRQLEHLDVSGNALASLPPEIGMLSALKELYVFDNHLKTLPAQMGQLFELQTLGIEGNPLEASLKAMIQNQGTRAVVVWLRDNSIDPPEPPPRSWKYIAPSAEYEQSLLDPSAETFTLLCHNILCERAAVEKLYGYTPKPALGWDRRKKRILGELLQADADFLCLQEVETAQYEEFFLPNMPGYQGVFVPKSRWKNKSDDDRRHVDGCATFFRSDKWEQVSAHSIDFTQLAMARPDFSKDDVMFIRMLHRDNIALVLIVRNLITGTKVAISNTHMHWDPNMCDVKLVQTGLMVEKIEELLQSPSGMDDDDIPWANLPLIICGDFNSVPSSGVYEFLETGSLAPDHVDFLKSDYGRFTKEGMRHPFPLRSAYSDYRSEERGPEDEAASRGSEFPYTNYTPSFVGVLDYIFYSTSSLSVNKVLGELDKTYMSNVPGLPNAHYPSDHIAIAAEFQIKHRAINGRFAAGY